MAAGFFLSLGDVPIFPSTDRGHPCTPERAFAFLLHLGNVWSREGPRGVHFFCFPFSKGTYGAGRFCLACICLRLLVCVTDALLLESFMILMQAPAGEDGNPAGIRSLCCPVASTRSRRGKPCGNTFPLLLGGKHPPGGRSPWRLCGKCRRSVKAIRSRG